MLIGDTSPVIKKRKSLFGKRNIFVVVLIALIVGLVYYFIQYQKLSKNPDTTVQEKTVSILNEISNITLLPNEPNPEIATIADIEKLKGEAFFDNAQNGDYVVIFTQAKIAIIYRASIKKIINIGPLVDTGTAPKNNQ